MNWLLARSSGDPVAGVLSLIIVMIGVLLLRYYWRNPMTKSAEKHKAAMIVEEELRRIDDKLEAIKEHLTNRPMINKDNFYKSDLWFIQLRKILEAED